MTQFTDPPGAGLPAPIAALLISEDQRLHQQVLTLAASAGVRVLTAEQLPDFDIGRAPQPPLYIFGSDKCHLLPAPVERRCVVVTLESATAPVPDFELIQLPTAQARLLTHLATAANTVQRRAIVVRVRGILGGVGTTTTAALLAGAAASLDKDVCLVEGTVAAPALELMLGLESDAAPRWGALLNSAGQLRDVPNPDALRLALPRWRGLRALLRKPGTIAPTPQAAADVIGALARAEGIIIVDGGTPPSGTPRPAARLGVDVEILLVPPTVTATVSAHALIDQTHRAPVVLTRARRGSVLTESDLRRAISVPFLGKVPEISGLQDLADRGLGLPNPRARCWNAARTLLQAALATVSLPASGAGVNATPRPPALRVVRTG